jgi:hypothetical protein
LPLDASVPVIVASLEGYDLGGLCRLWRDRLGGEAPAHLPRSLLMRALAYRLQAEAYGDLDKATRRIIRGEDGDNAPFDRRLPETKGGVGLKPGALLVREWRGKLERVMVLEEGFAWNGQTYGSLSQIAKAMTGTNWNGHRFFGLRQGKLAKPEAASPCRHEANKAGPKAEPRDALRDLHPGLNRSGSGAGLQFLGRPEGVLTAGRLGAGRRP